MATVSAIIATYNRADVLRRALEGLRSQSSPPAEIMVLDDASPDGTRAMMRTEFPDVRYVRAPHNMGQAFNRNLGVMSTAGDYILSIDDDAWFETPDGLARAVAFMEAHPDVGALALNVRLPNGWLFLPPGTPERDVSSYIGCGCLFRRSAAERTLYISELQGNGEEPDRAIRLYDLGLRVVALPDIVVFHELSTKNRNWARFRFTLHRNNLIREVARCPLALLPWRLLSVWAGQTLTNLKGGYFTVDLRVLWHLPWILRVGLRHRAPVRVGTYRRWRALARNDTRDLGGPQGPRETGGADA